MSQACQHFLIFRAMLCLLVLLCVTGCSKKITEQNLIGTWRESYGGALIEIKSKDHFVAYNLPATILDSKAMKRVNGKGKWQLSNHSIPAKGSIDILFYFTSLDAKPSHKIQQMLLSYDNRQLTITGFTGDDPDISGTRTFTKIK